MTQTASSTYLVLDITHGTLTPGTPVQIYPTNQPPSPNQHWTLTSDGYIENQSTPNLVLATKGGTVTLGAPVIVSSKNTPATPDQLWTLTSDGYIENKSNPDFVLDVKDGRLVATQPVQLWVKNTPVSPNQQWTLSSDGYIQSQAGPGIITVHNQGAYVAHCTVEYDYNGQHQSQSSGDLPVLQTFSVPTPLGAANLHVVCTCVTGLVGNPQRTIIDWSYPCSAIETFVLAGTTFNPTYSAEYSSGLANELSFTFINDIGQPVYAAVHHAGATGLPWRDGKPKCWDQTIQPELMGSYVPSGWIKDFSLWATLIADGLFCIVAVAATIATAGAAAPVDVAAGEMTAATVAEVTAETVGETAAEAASSSSTEVAVSSSIEAASSESAFNEVASSLGMDSQEFADKLGPYVQLAQKYGSAALKVGSVVKDAVVAAVAVNTYKTLESQGWALYIEVAGMGYYVSNYIVAGGNIYIPISLNVNGLAVKIQNQGAYVARSTIEYDINGQHQSQSSDSIAIAQDFSVLVPPGATNIHVTCDCNTGIAWNPWHTFLDQTYPGPAKLGTHKTYTLTGITSDPTYGEDGVTQPSSAPTYQITMNNQGGYVARCSIDYDDAGQHQNQSSGNFDAAQSYSVAIPTSATNIHVKCEDETGLFWDPWKTVFEQTYASPVRLTINMTGTTLNPGYNLQ